MKRMLKILAIIVVVALAGTYAMYAMWYRGNYNLTVKVQLNVSSERELVFSEFTSSSEPTDALEFWNQLKGGGTGATEGYIIYWDLDSGWRTLTTRTLIPLGESKLLEQTFSNINAGETTLTITVRDAFGASLLEKTYTVVVG